MARASRAARSVGSRPARGSRWLGVLVAARRARVGSRRAGSGRRQNCCASAVVGMTSLWWSLVESDAEDEGGFYGVVPYLWLALVGRYLRREGILVLIVNRAYDESERNFFPRQANERFGSNITHM